VGDADVSDVLITVAAPGVLPRVHGQITGQPDARVLSATVELTGPIVGSLQTPVRKDGSFEFAAVIPGVYRLRLPQIPDVAPIQVVVTSATAEVRVALPNR
jgi:hypothetical protein